MKETVKLRINYDYASLLFKADEGKNLGTSIKVVELLKDDPRYKQVPIIAKEVRRNFDQTFLFGWEIKRKYNSKELNTAPLFQIKISNTFEPTGEECGTLYDESKACEICGANRKQIGPLMLKNGSIPKRDIAKTVAGEIVISEKFATALKQRGVKGVLLEPVIFDKGVSNYYQLLASIQLELSQNTITGINPFDLSTSSDGEIYKCPKGHTIGLNLLSEAYVFNSPSIAQSDFYSSKQLIGVKRGLLRPEPLYLCSHAFKKLVEEERLSGLNFEIAHIQ